MTTETPTEQPSETLAASIQRVLDRDVEETSTESCDDEYDELLALRDFRDETLKLITALLAGEHLPTR
ncbi:hypothetical protein ABZW10_33180 [Kitasatospora sp. NPDC004723]|uniref:hypothetical protein n=1 Tax=Kitasatospora sp. NPDC004723 TaxID=3154288 RepID=UPI0033B73845